MNNNINCESCGRYLCECKQIIAEQEAIERLQEMPVEEAVRELSNEDIEIIAKVLGIEIRQVLMVLEDAE